MIEEFMTSYVTYFVVPSFLVAVTFYLVRFIKGPGIANRIIAIGCISYSTCFLMVIMALYFRSIYLIPLAFLLSLLVFLLDLYVGKYLEVKELGA